MEPSAGPSPPLLQVVNIIDLVSVDDSKITSVSVYSGRAEVTRLFTFAVKTGQNQVNIRGLPNVLEQESLRVEGRGAATIHDVTISDIPPPVPASASPALETLLLKRNRTAKALDRCRRSLASLEAYLSTLNAEHIDAPNLGSIIESYDATAEKWDDKALGLEKQLAEVDAEIKVEQEELAGPTGNEKLNLKATIGVFAESEGEVEIALIYAVHGATWDAFYDIRVSMQTKETPVTLIYKAAITQNTGEAWEDVPLILETATPTFGVGVPTLSPWILSVYQSRSPMMVMMPQSAQAAPPMGRLTTSRGHSPASPAYIPAPPVPARAMEYRGLSVSSKGNVSATFRVPGMINIPSDNVAHNVTIVQLKLEASMSWVSVPKEDTKAHLTARIKNASEYTLLRGGASVHVDGSFISKSGVPPVSPEESFDCPLGLDPSIRVTYHHRVKKASQGGFYNKTTIYTLSQRITVFNSKSSAIDNLKIIDQVPVSEDSQIVIKLVNPPLIGSASSDIYRKAPAKDFPPSKISTGVVAQWDGTDEPDFDPGSLGKDGKINWVCSVPSQETVNLVLQWEVTAPTRSTVIGL